MNIKFTKKTNSIPIKFSDLEFGEVFEYQLGFSTYCLMKVGEDCEVVNLTTKEVDNWDTDKLIEQEDIIGRIEFEGF